MTLPTALAPASVGLEWQPGSLLRGFLGLYDTQPSYGHQKRYGMRTPVAVPVPDQLRGSWVPAIGRGDAQLWEESDPIIVPGFVLRGGVARIVRDHGLAGSLERLKSHVGQVFPEHALEVAPSDEKGMHASVTIEVSMPPIEAGDSLVRLLYALARDPDYRDQDKVVVLLRVL